VAQTLDVPYYSVDHEDRFNTFIRDTLPDFEKLLLDGPRQSIGLSANVDVANDCECL
jgi:hypothetical protein